MGGQAGGQAGHIRLRQATSGSTQALPPTGSLMQAHNTLGFAG